jgi:hypothetical protein
MSAINARSMKLKIGSTTYGDFTKAELTSDDKKDVTFGEIQSSDTKIFSLEITFLQDFASGSIWKALYDATGDLAVTLIPYGNAAPAVGQEHVTFTATVLEKPTIGGSADVDGRFTSDAKLKLTGAYVLDGTP